MREKIGIMFVILCMLLLIGCSKKEINDVVKEQAGVVVDAFDKNDMDAINWILLEAEEVEFDEQLVTEFGFINKGRENGILQPLFAEVSLELCDVKDETVIYEINAPDMSDFFSKNKDKLADMKQDEIRKFFCEYVLTSHKSKERVGVFYKTVGEKVVFNYRTRDFMNAITGGLLDGYIELYKELFDEYRGEGG